jgi:hypothetical protein
MSAVAALPAAGPGAGQGLALERLASLLDPAFLEEIGWDAAAEAIAPPLGHPQLRRPGCLVPGCGVPSAHRTGLCTTCQHRYRSSGLDLAVFVTVARVRVQDQTPGSSLLRCAVRGCPRPAKSAPAKLCAVHLGQQRRLGLPLTAFLTHPQVRPLPSFGTCRVAVCLGPAKCFLGVHAAWLSSSPTGGCWSSANGLPICDSTWVGVIVWAQWSASDTSSPRV